jgi:hypothetical protein
MRLASRSRRGGRKGRSCTARRQGRELEGVAQPSSPAPMRAAEEPEGRRWSSPPALHRRRTLKGWPPLAFCFVVPGPLAFLPLRRKGGREVWANAAQYEGRGL